MNESELQKIADRYQLELVVAYGAYAEGKTHSKHDVDLAVSYGRRLSLGDRLALRQLLSDRFSREVNVVDFDNISPPILEKILESNDLLYGEEELFEEISADVEEEQVVA